MRIAVVVLLLVISVCAVALRGREAAAHEPPPIFADLTVEEAQARAVSEGRLLVVKATATWCGACRRMDQTTWRDPAVEAWAAARAVVIAVDVDRNATGAAWLRVTSIPTTVVFRGGREIGRAEGYRSAEQLVPWLSRFEPR